MNHPVTFEHYATISPMSSLLDEQGERKISVEIITDIIPLQLIDSEYQFHLGLLEKAYKIK